MKVIALIGASGFIGKHLISLLSARQDVEIRVLIHHKEFDAKGRQNVVFFDGDLLKPETLAPLFEPGCFVINLAYLTTRTFQDNFDAMVNLAEVCAKRKIKRLIHCSTAVVAGNVSAKIIDETTPCHPVSEYQKAKLALEKVLFERSRDRFEISILRPTAVFGPGGKNLVKLADELLTGNRLISYARSCLHGRRSMNLVCVENVVAALAFLLDADRKVDREVFIISDDDAPINNYQDIENRLIQNLKLEPFPFARVTLPRVLLTTLLQLTKKFQGNPFVKYSDRKLAGLGFEKTMALEAGIDIFSAWYTEANEDSERKSHN